MVPVTNPFLRELLETFLNVGGRKGKINFDELGISEVVQLLRDADMPAVLRDFGDRNPDEDPAIHFYELFLKEYDPKKRMQRGVFYTPRPVVSFIVRSVHELLQKEFGLADGLADITTWGELASRHKNLAIPDGVSADEPFVKILDPATGTGTFLVEAIDIIFQTMEAKWLKAGHMALEIPNLWNEYVPKHLLPRVYGYELMMAPYAIAHMKVGLKLFETAYRFTSDERARIYLTNSLDPPQDFSDLLAFDSPALAHEAQAVNSVKRRGRFTVVIGNPPYFGEAGRGHEWIAQLMRGYEKMSGNATSNYFQVDNLPLGERNPKWLNDDYVKFIRLSEWIIESSGAGALGFITNHSYLDNPTFRGMRESLLSDFSQIYVYDLHGSAKKKETTRVGFTDENVFDIEQGVAINISLLNPSTTGLCNAFRGDMFGDRASKYTSLLKGFGTVSWNALSPFGPNYLLDRQGSTLGPEYERGWRLQDVMPVNSVGIVTARDELTIRPTRADIWQLVQDFATMAPEKARLQYDLGPDARDWQVKLAQADLRNSGPTKGFVKPILYRPFDRRWTYYTGVSRGFLCMPRPGVMDHMLQDNLAICVGRAGQVIDQGEWNIVICSNCPTDFNLFRRGGNVVFPLYLVDRNNRFEGHKTTVTNFSRGFLEALCNSLSVPGKSDGLPGGVEDKDIIHYAYSVLHSRSYRARYAEFLKLDFPRLPLTSSLELLRELARLGGELVGLHLLASPLLDKSLATYKGRDKPDVEKVSHSHHTVWINKDLTSGFHGVPEDVWAFQIGGYQVCEKWLKDRKGSTLSKDDINHYQRIITALSETIRIMAEIDKVIDKHGGWPGAFVTSAVPKGKES
jgi:predicted helicase